MIVLFDIDDTLLDQRHAESLAAEVFLNQFASRLDRSYSVTELSERWRSLRERHSPPYFAAKISFQERRRRRIRDLFADGARLTNVEADARFLVFFEAYRRHWRLFPDVLPCLRELRGMRLGVLSNGNRLQQLEKLHRTGIEQHFELIVTSEQHGCAKPDPGLFQAACAEADVDPTSAVYVGDRLENDARAACNAGLRGIWLDRSGADGPSDVEHMRSLQDFPGLLAAIPPSGPWRLQLK